MFLYLIQHALAKSKEEDPGRGLTPTGITITKIVAQYLAKLAPSVTEIWYSSKPRSKQTAEIFARALDAEKKLREYPGITPLDTVDDIAQQVNKLAKNIAIVGHLPHLGRLSSLLLCGDADANIIAFQNSGIVCLKKEENKWQIAWIIQPQNLAP